MIVLTESFDSDGIHCVCNKTLCNKVLLVGSVFPHDIVTNRDNDSEDPNLTDFPPPPFPLSAEDCAFMPNDNLDNIPPPPGPSVQFPMMGSSNNFTTCIIRVLYIEMRPHVCIRTYYNMYSFINFMNFNKFLSR